MTTVLLQKLEGKWICVMQGELAKEECRLRGEIEYLRSDTAGWRPVLGEGHKWYRADMPYPMSIPSLFFCQRKTLLPITRGAEILSLPINVDYLMEILAIFYFSTHN